MLLPLGLFYFIGRVYQDKHTLQILGRGESISCKADYKTDFFSYCELHPFIIVFPSPLLFLCRTLLGSAPCYNISACSVWRLFPCHHSFSVGKGEQLLGIKSSSSKPASTLVKKGDGWSVDFNGKYSPKHLCKVPWYQPSAFIFFYGSSAITHISSGSLLDGRFSQGKSPKVLGGNKNKKKKRRKRRREGWKWLPCIDPLPSHNWKGKLW